MITMSLADIIGIFVLGIVCGVFVMGVCVIVAKVQNRK